MPTARSWKNVAVAMQSALGAAKTITAITKANPGVATSTAHGLANGTYVLLKIQGMYQLDYKVVRVANQAANTFELEGVDTTLFDTFSSGTAEAITFGTSITSATDINASGGEADKIDTSTIHGSSKSSIPGPLSELEYSFNNLWDLSDAGQIALKAANDAQAQRAFTFTFGTGGPKMVFVGYVAFSGAPTGTAFDKIVTPAKITVLDGSKLTFYAA